MWYSTKQILNDLQKRPQWINKNPIKSGKYIVKTKTMMNNIHIIEATYNIHTNKWNFSNQSFIEYLKY